MKRVVPDSVLAAGEPVKLTPGEQSAHVADGEWALLTAGLAKVPRKLIVVPRPVCAGVLFSLRYRSGVPCLPAFRFPAPQNGADITPFSLIMLYCFAECRFNPICRVMIGSILQFIRDQRRE